ncbi:hypothetical protein D4Q76_02850, partial [archaeon]
EEKQIKQMQLQVLPEVKPFFANGFSVGNIFNEYKNKKREAIINLIAIYQNIVVSNISITVEHAKALIDILKIEIEKAEKFEKTGERPKQIVPEKTTGEQRYIG